MRAEIAEVVGKFSEVRAEEAFPECRGLVRVILQGEVFLLVLEQELASSSLEDSWIADPARSRSTRSTTLDFGIAIVGHGVDYVE